MIRAAIDESFKANVKIRKLDDGTYAATCKKGLWRVHGKTKGFTLREARWYFSLYYYDGEYDK